MEMISVRIPRESARSHELFVAHSDLELQRGLEPGERLVVQDARAGGAFAATVTDVEFLIDDTVYRLNLRGRLPHGVAAKVPAPRKAQRIEVVDVLELLAWMREPTEPNDSDELADTADEPVAARG